MDVAVCRGALKGAEVRVPPSKSVSHRLLIAAALADGVSVVRNVADNADIRATIGCLQALGASFSISPCAEGALDISVRGIGGRISGSGLSAGSNPGLICDAGESGSTLRFLLPLFCLFSGKCVFRTSGRLSRRPMDVYERLFSLTRDRDSERDIIVASGTLKSGAYRVPGNISSQFITGLLFALPLLEGQSTIAVEAPFESASYVNLTLEALGRAGIKVFREGDVFTVPGGQAYRPFTATVPPDASQAAFFAVLAGLGRVPVAVAGFDPDSVQGDSVIAALCEQSGMEVAPLAGGCRFSVPSSVRLRGIKASLADCPDLGPALFAFASALEGPSVFADCSRLRMKESDRIAAMAAELGRTGCATEENTGTVVIRPAAVPAKPERFDSHNDHRVAMALAVLAACFDEPTVISGAESVGKSFPGFFEELRKLGAEVKEV